MAHWGGPSRRLLRSVPAVTWQAALGNRSRLALHVSPPRHAPRNWSFGRRRRRPTRSLTPCSPFSLRILVRSASRSAGRPSSGPYWLTAGSAAAAAAAASAPGGGAQWTLPCARLRVPGVDATSALVLTMQGESVARTRRDGAGCCCCVAVGAAASAALPASAAAAAADRRGATIGGERPLGFADRVASNASCRRAPGLAASAMEWRRGAGVWCATALRLSSSCLKLRGCLCKTTDHDRRPLLQRYSV